MVLNICERIGVRVPVDLSILVTWRIVTFVVVGGARACQNFEMSGLLVQPAYTKTFTLWPYYSTYPNCVCKIPKGIFD